MRALDLNTNHIIELDKNAMANGTNSHDFLLFKRGYAKTVTTPFSDS